MSAKSSLATSMKSARTWLAVTASLLGACLVASFALFDNSMRFSSPAPDGPFSTAVREVLLTHAAAPPIAARIWHPARSPDPRPAVPIVLYAASWGGVRGENDVLLSRLASHGFVVIATDDVFHDPPSTIAEPSDEEVRKAPFRLSTADEFAAFPEIGLRRSRLGRRKLSEVLDRLARLGGEIGPLALDLRNVSVVGFSHGGAVAGAALAKDERVAAAVNLDGWVIGAEGMDIPAGKPLLSLYAEPVVRSGHLWPTPSSGWLTRMIHKDFEAQLELSRRSMAHSLLIAGAGHADFNDTLHEPRRWLQWRPWRRDMIGAGEMRKLLDEVVVAFLKSPVDLRSERGWMSAAERHARVRPLAPGDAIPE
jgi:dienelactone hydrolase